MAKRVYRRVLLAVLAGCLVIMAAFLSGPGWTRTGSATGPAEVPGEAEVINYPVVLDNKPLFVVRNAGAAVSPAERAALISRRLLALAEDKSADPGQLRLVAAGGIAYLEYQGQILLTLTKADAEVADRPVEILGQIYLDKIREAIADYRYQRTPAYLLRSIGLTTVATLGLVLGIRLSLWGMGRLLNVVLAWSSSHLPSLSIGSLELIPAGRLGELVVALLRFVRLVLLASLGILYLAFVLRLFPWTEYLGVSLTDNLASGAGAGFQAVIAYLPNLGLILVTAVATYYCIQFSWYLFGQIREGTLVIPGFYRDWANPTAYLVTILILAIGAALMLPYLPGFESPAFRGVSVFLGILLSLGSTATVTNVVAGLILIYTRAFQVGDVVRIGETKGMVVQKALLATQIRTPRNVLVTIPNAIILNTQITNFSALIRDENAPLMIHTAVTLGYDIPWTDIYAALRAAALRTTHILHEPEPFVWQSSLNDFHITYEINAYTTRPELMPWIFSELHQNIQDCCNEAGIEILSPGYSAVRDGNTTTIPETYRPADYEAPGFRLFSFLNPGRPPHPPV